MITQTCSTIPSSMLSRKRTHSQKDKSTSIIDKKITSYFTNKKGATITPSKLKEFELSSKAMHLIEEVKNNSIKREKIQISILDSFPLREKFHSLINRELPLPLKYKKLLNTFISIDKELFNGMKNIHCFDKEELEQILFVYEECFLIKDGTISINYNNQEEFTTDLLSRREKTFRNKLIHLVNKQHKVFLSSLPIKEHFDPLKCRTWHSMFDLEGCSDIKKIDITY